MEDANMAKDGPCIRCGGPHRSDGTIVDDPLYTIRGHVPVGVQLDCWYESKTELMSAAAFIQALHYWAVGGYTQAEAAQKAGMAYRTFERKLKTFRQKDKIVAEKGLSRACTIRRGCLNGLPASIAREAI